MLAAGLHDATYIATDDKLVGARHSFRYKSVMQETNAAQSLGTKPLSCAASWTICAVRLQMVHEVIGAQWHAAGDLRCLCLLQNQRLVLTERLSPNNKSSVAVCRNKGPSSECMVGLHCMACLSLCGPQQTARELLWPLAHSNAPLPHLICAILSFDKH